MLFVLGGSNFYGLEHFLLELKVLMDVIEHIDRLQSDYGFGDGGNIGSIAFLFYCLYCDFRDDGPKRGELLG